MEDTLYDWFALDVFTLIVDADIITDAESAVRDFQPIDILLVLDVLFTIAWTS